MQIEHIDVIVVGAGLSGICAAYYLQTLCPSKRYAIFEGRDTIGGTWDLFRYPGVRSDSDMHTLGYSFRPWHDPSAIASGPTIRQYIEETAAQFGIDKKIRYQHSVCLANWSSKECLWTIEAEIGPERERRSFTCGFLLMCSGYYQYAEGYAPHWPGEEQFEGQIVHPQHWPEHLDYSGKRVVVIGSGATAVTLVPALAERAAHVTMLQRSPSYVVALASHDALAARLRPVVGANWLHAVARWRSILVNMAFYTLAQRFPQAIARLLITQVRNQLGAEYDVATHFTPRYGPWDQRLCVVPNGDLFAAIKTGRASVATDGIKGFTRTGIQIETGQELPADIVVTATGLQMQVLGGATLAVDGVPVDPGKTLTYKGTMYSDVPNLASVFGYTNASWTLKCELIARYVCRLINYMDQHGYVSCTPQRAGAAASDDPTLNLDAGYIRRAAGTLPRQGRRKPWRMYQNYIRDLLLLRFSRIPDTTLRFAGRSRSTNKTGRRGR